MQDRLEQVGLGRNQWKENRGNLHLPARKSQLEVWKLRKQRKAFKEIGKIQKVPVFTAKERFYAAFRNTQGFRYDPEFWRDKLKKIREEELENKKDLCTACPDRATCHDPCPAAMEYADQDRTAGRREMLATDPSLIENYNGG